MSRPPGDGADGDGVRVGVISLGCAKNLVDSEVMSGHLDRAGYHFVTDPHEADVIVVNTCGFIEPAREESIRTILEAAELKRAGKLRRLVVAGCMVHRYRDELRRELPEVDAFVDLDELDRVVERAGLRPLPPRSDLPLVRCRVSRPAATKVSAPAPASLGAWHASSYLYDDATPRRTATPPWTAYVKIAEGCDHTCSFCAIPTFRGRFRSRRPESIVREARHLAGQGVVEINLIAQDSSHYGRDLGLREGLADLLEQLDGVDGLSWIRLHYLYPNTVSDRLVEAMARLPRVLHYVDLPLQHAHPATLRRMRRGGSADSHLRLLERFRQAMPDVTLRTTFIVGFPGESEAEFATLERFVSDARFDHVGVFVYSHEERTAAFDSADDVPTEVKHARRDRLMQLQQHIVFQRNASWVGREVEVLVEGAHPETDHLLVGRLRGQSPDVDGQVLLNDGSAAPGALVTARITDVAGYDLVGAILDHD